MRLTKLKNSFCLPMKLSSEVLALLKGVYQKESLIGSLLILKRLKKNLRSPLVKEI
jgi:hypothetical protein